LSTILSGNGDEPTEREKDQIARALDVPVDVLFDDRFVFAVAVAS
jgi:hypothetical protein